MHQEIVDLAEKFLKEFPNEEKAKYWKAASNAFKIFWKNKIINDNVKTINDFEDLDPIIRLLDINGKRRYEIEEDREALKQQLLESGRQYKMEYAIDDWGSNYLQITNVEGAARTLVTQKLWYQIFQDLKSSSELANKLDQIFNETNPQKIAKYINDLKRINSKNSNFLTKPAGIALSAILFVNDPQKYFSVVSLNHRKKIIKVFDLGQISKQESYGTQIIKSNYLLSKFNEKFGTNFSPRGLSWFLYEKELFEIWQESRIPSSMKGKKWWVEKTYLSGVKDRQSGDYALGKALWSPQRDKGNRDIYSNMRKVSKGDIVLHLVDNKEFIGISVVKNECDADFSCLPGTSHDDGTGKRPGYFIALENYKQFKTPISRFDILNKKYKDSLYRFLEKGNWLFYNKKMELNQGSYLTEAPLELIKIINEIYKEKNNADLPFFSNAGKDIVSPPEVLPSSYTIEEFISETGFKREEIKNWLQILHRKKQIIFQGPPGTGKTFVALRLANLLISGTKGLKELVQFHPDYSYEDFIQGYYPEPKNGILNFELRPGRFLEFCEEANRTNGSPCVLIIDEINRAHLARVFGELMYLLEYREKTIPLAAGGKRFCIPPNVYLIGTMNTADRSIALVDHALRRRFAFIRLKPKYDILERYLKQYNLPTQSLIDVLRRINNAIDDQNYEIGISFFMKDEEKLMELLPTIWKSEIESYLEEYFYDQPGKVKAFRWESLANDELKDWVK